MYGSTDPEYYPAPWAVHLEIGDTVYVGFGSQHDVHMGEHRRATLYVTHPAYTYATNYIVTYDIALIAIYPPFVYSDSIRGVQLPTISVQAVMSGATIPPKFEPLWHLSRWTNCQFAGTGRTLHGDRCQKSKVLRFMRGILLTVDHCNPLLKQGSYAENLYVHPTFCLQNNSDAACAGDSGGGVTCLSETDTEPALIGIMRAGNNCCDSAGAKINAPMPRNIVPLDFERRLWISRMVNNFYRHSSFTYQPWRLIATEDSSSEEEPFVRIEDDDWL